MPVPIELQDMQDHDLLVMAVRDINNLCESVKTQNGRIRTLEDWRNIITGGMGILVFIGIPILVWALNRIS